MTTFSSCILIQTVALSPDEKPCFPAPTAASGISAQLVQLFASETKADYLLGVALAVIAAGGLKIVVGE